jgi:hypothetical protein
MSSYLLNLMRATFSISQSSKLNVYAKNTIPTLLSFKSLSKYTALAGA